MFYSCFAALGSNVIVEEGDSCGRLDMAARAGGQVNLFGFKVLERAGPGTAMGPGLRGEVPASERAGALGGY